MSFFRRLDCSSITAQHPLGFIVKLNAHRYRHNFSPQGPTSRRPEGFPRVLCNLFMFVGCFRVFSRQFPARPGITFVKNQKLQKVEQD